MKLENWSEAGKNERQETTLLAFFFIVIGGREEKKKWIRNSPKFALREAKVTKAD